MASLMKLPGGRWRIQFVGTDDKVRSLRPGRMPQRAADWKFVAHRCGPGRWAGSLGGTTNNES